MKKILLLIIFFFFSFCIVKADVMPFYTSIIRHTGIGVLNTPQEYTLYSEPTIASDVIAEVYYDVNGVSFNIKRYPVHHLYVAFSPRKQLAFATVIDENDKGWYKICYNQETGKSAWVYNSKKEDFFVWKDFYDYYGRKYGIYAFRDIPDSLKKLYSGPGEDSQVLQSFSYARHIKLNMIRGNWILVTLLDLQNMSKIGWVKWRSPEGKLYYFPSIQETFGNQFMK